MSYSFSPEYIQQRAKETKIFNFLFLGFVLSVVAPIVGALLTHIGYPIFMEIGFKAFMCGICLVSIGMILLRMWKDFKFKQLRSNGKI